MKLVLIVMALFLAGCAAQFGPGEYGWASWNLENKLNLQLRFMDAELCIGCLEVSGDPNEPGG